MVTWLEASARAPTMRSCRVSGVGRIDHLGIDGHRDHLTAALHRDLHQPAAGLTVHLGVGQGLLRLHELLLYLLRLRKQGRHVGCASGLHDWVPLPC
ncbi:hypothetical protein ATO49_26740 [Mycolicibacterium fortuitum subsp. fortuitum DSM 46621 = ATCC 6841 = JCM 6387]|nr:hypothetical protein ATO49_26740 [Mycolicibacterium fortuitum subsp. fortuitum DSM 46621 = ATCC 6841 = JCM 6387]